MHGEYKMSGGKWVVIDLDVHDDRLANVQFSGDFLLEPDHAMHIINAALDAWYQALNEITSASGKIAGAAHTHRGGAVLHHETMAYNIDAEKMFQVLRIGREKLSDKGTTSAAKRVDPLRSQTGLPREAVIGSMFATFCRLHSSRRVLP